MTTYYRYRILCNTEGTYKYWNLLDTDPVPTTCPTDTGHDCDTNSVTIIDTISQNFVKIKQESISTGENFMSETPLITAATGPDVVTATDFSWPIPISVLSISAITDSSHTGDSCEVTVAPDTIIGILTASAATGANVFNVSQTVIDYTMNGYYIDLFDGVHTDHCDRVVAINKEENTITMETPTTRSFSAYLPTYIKQTIYTVKNFYFGPAGTYSIGVEKLVGSHVPANVLIRVLYNNSHDSAKKVYPKLDYMY